MKKRYDLQKNAEATLKDLVGRYLYTANKNLDVSAVYQEFVDSQFILISPPEEEPPMMQYLTMDSLRNYNWGRSIKAGNIQLNIKKLVDAFPSMIEMAVSMAVDIPILKICAGLNLWKSLRNIATVEISKEQAFVLVALWKNCDYNQKIALEDGLDAANALCGRYGEPQFTEIKYNQVIDTLVRLGCINLNEGVVWLKEQISKSYIDSV